MAKTRVRNLIMSADYSQQEPKILAQLCEDPQMIQAYIEGKDLYAQIAALSFHRDYANCLEFFPKGTPIKEENGKWVITTESEATKIANGETDTNIEGKKIVVRDKGIYLLRRDG